MEYKQRIILKPILRITSVVHSMKHQNNIEVQAVNNLLFIGDDSEDHDFDLTFPRKGLGIIDNLQNKAKSNTVHLRTHKNNIYNPNPKTQSLHHSPHYHHAATDNKENLKKILKQLEHSPSPPTKRKVAPKDTRKQRVSTQNSEKVSREKAKNLDLPSNYTQKQSLEKLFGGQRDRNFIKTLIKAKIVQKLKDVESRHGDRKVGALGSKMQAVCRKGRGSQGLRTSKSRELKSKFLELLQKEKKMNNPVISRKHSRLTIKKLLL